MTQVTDEHQLQTALQTLLSQNNDRLILLGFVGFVLFLIVLVLVFRTVANNQGKQLDLMRDLNKSNDKRNDEFNGKMDRLTAVVESALNASSSAAIAQTGKMEELSARMAYLAENQNRFFKEAQTNQNAGSDKLVASIEAQTKEIQLANVHQVNYHNLMDDNIGNLAEEIKGLKDAITQLFAKVGEHSAVSAENKEAIEHMLNLINRIWDKVNNGNEVVSDARIP